MHIFDWGNQIRWLKEVNIYAQSLLNQKIRQQLKQKRPTCWSDDFSWLPLTNGDENFAKSFSKYYSHIRCFHGCRPENLDSYFSHGLRGQRATSIEDIFFRIFSEMPRRTLQKIANEFRRQKEYEKGKLWVSLEQDFIIRECGHYLIQGSEYLMGLANYLSADSHLRLREFGIPTIFEINIPILYFDQSEIWGLSRLVLSEWGQSVTKILLSEKDTPSLTLRRNVEPKHIVGHIHPSCIPDPHYNFSDFHNPIVTCKYCN